MSTNQVEKPTQRNLGRSDTASLSEQFPATPKDLNVRGFMKAILDGEVGTGRTDGIEGVKTLADGPIGPLLDSFNMDYEGAPNILDDIIQKDLGIVGFVPNPTPPGPGDVNPANKGPAPVTNFPPPSSGFGSTTSPIETSPVIADQEFDKILPGKSGA